MMRKIARSVSHEEEDIKEFRKDPKEAIGYLNACVELAFEENDPQLILTGIAKVAKAYGKTRLAKEAELQRESLHRMLAKGGNPEWNSLFRVFRALGVRPKLEWDKRKAA